MTQYGDVKVDRCTRSAGSCFIRVEQGEEQREVEVGMLVTVTYEIVPRLRMILEIGKKQSG